MESAFVSYAREDRPHVEALEEWVNLYKQKGLVCLWSDAKIRAGDAWSTEIEKALEASNIAVLILTIKAVNSIYIRDTEIPAIRNAVDHRGMRLLLVQFDPLPADVFELSKFQYAYTTEIPFEDLTPGQRKLALKKIADEIRDAAAQRDGSARAGACPPEPAAAPSLAGNGPAAAAPPAPSVAARAASAGSIAPLSASEQALLDELTEKIGETRADARDWRFWRFPSMVIAGALVLCAIGAFAYAQRPAPPLIFCGGALMFFFASRLAGAVALGCDRQRYAMECTRARFAEPDPGARAKGVAEAKAFLNYPSLS